MIKRSKIEYNKEKQILVNLILNTEFCREILPYTTEDYFRSPHARQIISWVKDYYEEYNKAPSGHIADIYESQKTLLDGEVSEQIQQTLTHLESVADVGVQNIKYLVDSAIAFFEERHTTLQLEAAQHYLSKGLVSKAKEAMGNSLSIQNKSFEWVAFNDLDYTTQVVRSMVVQKDLDEAFFAFPDRLGRFIGPIDRGWFVAWFAPAKRGKTTYMTYSLVHAILRKLNVVLFSLEMPIDQLYSRYLAAVTGDKPELGDRVVMTPIMDCHFNQTGTCDLEQRVGFGNLLTSEGRMPTYDEASDWEVCTACRGETNFKPSSWKVPVRKKNVTETEYVKKAMAFNKYWGKHCRAIHIPSKTATVSDLQTEVELLRQRENFIPDVIIIDYADLIKPDSHDAKRHQLDDIWEELRAWGQTDSALIITASQTNRLSADAQYMKATHVAEDWSKAAKVDIAIGLCQSDTMKEYGMMNINKVLHRHEEFVESHVCTILQELSTQQAELDSEFSVM
jgi:hypothetical protein